MQKSERSQLYKIKKHKDLSFLLALQAETISENIIKYNLTGGSGPSINEIKIPLTVYYSYEKYDYTGKFVARTDNKSHSFPFVPKENDVEENNLGAAVLTMRVNQKSWFNIELYENEKEGCSGYKGYHYQVILDKFIYKNDNNFQSKKMIYEDNRQKAKVLFQKRNYKEALKIYKHSINILTGLSKKFFSLEQLKQLKEYSQKSETNFLKCLGKMNGFGGRHDKEISKQGKQILEKFAKKNPGSINSYYQKAIWLKYECRFCDAEDVIKEGLKQKFSQDPQTAAMQKNALKNMLEEVKLAKERNMRHLRREQIRKRKAAKRNEEVWHNDDEGEDTWD